MIHQIRNATKYAAYKDMKAVMAGLKQVYAAPLLDAAKYHLEGRRDKWGKKYPQILKPIGQNYRPISVIRRESEP